MMRISEIMSRDVAIAAPSDSIQKVAQRMAEIDAGFIPVGEKDRLVGMITDRDIVIRAVAKGKTPGKCVARDVMSPDVKYCYEDETLEDAARNMATLQVKRLPVLNRDKRLVGIVSLGDLACEPEADEQSKEALLGISQPA
jgi:CBS domain-containing protein